MGETKKKEFEDPINAKIQRKFDLVFNQPNEKDENFNENKSAIFNNGDYFDNDDFQIDGESSMSNGPEKKTAIEKSLPSLDLSFQKTGSSIKLAMVPDHNDLEFSLDFGDESLEIPNHPNSSSEKTAHIEEINSAPEESAMFELPTESESMSSLDTMFDAAIAESNLSNNDSTGKTVVFNSAQFQNNSFELDTASEINLSADLMSKEEAKANIESTIKDIIRPKNLDYTQELNPENMADDEEETVDFSGIEEFDLSSVEFADTETLEEVFAPKIQVQTESPIYKAEVNFMQGVQTIQASPIIEDDSPRVHATIRQLREEREELLIQIKNLKSGSRELEQDNLTLMAALDESKIEVSILRKRHMVEIEDFKYRLSLNEEKKEQAIEKARQAMGSKEKLEQRVRIDINQVMQREKELETKLEMLTIDVDSQVQSRDHKILELRRKIDSLEFNMENVSIKEHKSQDDKRKLEDKLNKIMKTLRHSIKNLEEDEEPDVQAVDDSKQSSGHRSGKT